MNIYIEGKRNSPYSLVISQSTENNNALILDWISKWTKLENLTTIISHFSSVQDQSGIKDQLKNIMHSNIFLRSGRIFISIMSKWLF